MWLVHRVNACGRSPNQTVVDKMDTRLGGARGYGALIVATMVEMGA